MATRRALDFRSYDEMVADVARLRERGYDRAGAWELPQTLAHLARTMNLAADPAAEPLPAAARWLARTLVLPRLLKRRRMPRRVPMPGPIRALPPVSPAQADAMFDAAVARALAHLGPKVRHPMLGDVPIDAWHQLQLIHAAHHLSFLVPHRR